MSDPQSADEPRESQDPEVPVEPEDDGSGDIPGGSKVAALILIMLVVGAVILWVGANEYRKRGAGSISGLTVADHLAKAQTEGGEAPDIELPAVTGPDVSLRSLRGFVVVVNFWASWCGPCREEAPDLRRASEDYYARGVRFLGVDERDDRASAAGFAREFKITYPSAFDPSGSLADDYRLDGLPSTFVVDADGQIRYRFFGFLNGTTIRAALDAMTRTPRSPSGTPAP